MTIKQLRESSGMSRREFAEYFGFKYRTLQDWELGNRESPAYLLELVAYKLQKVYLIYRDSIDDACEIKGYIVGTAADADRYCNELNENHKYSWEDYDWMEVEKLNE